MVIDFHTHAFPEKIAERAIRSLIQAGGALVPNTDGTVKGLLNALDEARVERAVVLPIATRPASQGHINDWALANRSERLEIFGTIHPDAPDALDELDRIGELGLKGIKMHPEYQDFYVDDPKMLPIYRKIARLGIITVFHAGLDIGYPPPAHCTPERLRRVLDEFEDAPVVAAHFGGYMQWEQVIGHLCGSKVYLDTSYCHGRIPHPLAEQIIASHDVGRILFGSDAPWGDIRREVALIRSLSLTEQECRMVLCDNAQRLLDGCRSK